VSKQKCSPARHLQGTDPGGDPRRGMGRRRPAGLSPLAADLANRGLLVVNAIYRAASREIGRSALDPGVRRTPRRSA
jgi:hypothetical protein